VLYGLNHEPHLISLMQLNKFLKSLVKATSFWLFRQNYKFPIHCLNQTTGDTKHETFSNIGFVIGNIFETVPTWL